MARPLRDPPLGFAHRGARAHAPENTIEAFELGLRLGAPALESDVWVTADGIPVLDHDGVVGSRLRRRPIAETSRVDLPAYIPTLAELYDAVGPVELSLDVKDPAAFDATVAVAAEAGAAERLWLCHHDHDVVTSWRARSVAVHLVDSTRLARIKEGPERRAALLHAGGVEAVNLHESDWTAGLVALFHRFGILCFGWDAQQPRILDALLSYGIDGVYSDHVDRMVDSLARAGRR